jgi:deoxyribonuclease-4
VTLDTCHLLGSGYDIRTADGLEATLNDAQASFGVDRIRLVHANDSKDGCGSTRDRHENLGAGTIGKAAFAELVRHPAVRGVPLIVETPSPPDSSGHAADIELLSGLAALPA